jgi:hypothetical protein
MAITPYTRQASFQSWEAVNPTAPKPAASFEAEFNAIKATTDSIATTAALIQRADGKLANGSVHRDALDAVTKALLGAPAFGPSINRPALGDTDAGATYFDTTLGKPIWWSGPQWVDATGAPV